MQVTVSTIQDREASEIAKQASIMPTLKERALLDAQLCSHTSIHTKAHMHTHTLYCPCRTPLPHLLGFNIYAHTSTLATNILSWTQTSDCREDCEACKTSGLDNCTKGAHAVSPDD